MSGEILAILQFRPNYSKVEKGIYKAIVQVGTGEQDGIPARALVHSAFLTAWCAQASSGITGQWHLAPNQLLVS